MPMDDLIRSQPFTASSGRHSILHIAHMANSECHVAWRSPRVCEVRPSGSMSSISDSLSFIEALFVRRYEDVVDAGSSRVFRGDPHRATPIRIEGAWIVQEVDSILYDDLKEALTMLLLRCLIDLEPCVRGKVQ